MVTHSWDPWAGSAYVAYVACHANDFLPTNGLFKLPNVRHKRYISQTPARVPERA